MTPRRPGRADVTQPTLDVYLYDRHIGTMGHDGPNVWFQYDMSVINDTSPEQWALSVRLPVRAEPYGHRDTLAFFDNLLLESDLRTELARAVQRDARDVSGLLGQVGAECAGAVALWPHQMAPDRQAHYRRYSAAQLAELFDVTHGERLTAAQLESRQSMSGVQDKLVFAWDAQTNTYNLPLRGAPSDVIVKRASSRYDGLVANELACLRAYSALGLAVPMAAAIPEMPDLMRIHRYDRVHSSPHSSVESSGLIRRLHQEDFCQITSRTPRQKYQTDNGPTLKDLADAIRRYSIMPAEDIRALLIATLATVCLGNMDAHGKNFSLLTTDQGRCLAPFYDVVCTEAYPKLSTAFSMKIGRATHPGNLQQTDRERVARDFSVQARLVSEVADFVTVQLLARWSEVRHSVAAEVGDLPVLQRLEAVIAKRIPYVQRLIK